MRLSPAGPGRLRVAGDEGEWDFAAAEARLSPRLGRLVRTLELPGGGQLQLEDSPLLDAWLPAGDRLESWVHRLERHRTAALSAAGATVLGIVLFFQVGLPWMAARLAPSIPRSVEQTVSRQSMALLDRTQFGPSRLTQARRDALAAEFADLVAGLPRAADYRLDFRDGRHLGPNAFALPDGRVLVTDELVELAASDDEVLAVLAHEAGHHEHRHGLRQALESSAVVVVAGLLFGDVSGTGSLSVSVPIMLVDSGFSRRKESEADVFAFDLLRRKGRSPADFAAILRRLSEHDGLGDLGPIGYLSTHPPSQQRIDAAEAAAKENGR